MKDKSDGHIMLKVAIKFQQASQYVIKTGQLFKADCQKTPNLKRGMREGGKTPSYKIEAQRHVRWASEDFLKKILTLQILLPGHIAPFFCSAVI